MCLLCAYKGSNPTGLQRRTRCALTLREMQQKGIDQDHLLTGQQ